MSDEKKTIVIDNQDINSEYDYDSLEKQLEENLKDNLDEFDFLKKEKAKISNPEYLGNAIMNVVWDQFVMQIGTVAGEDFIEKNKDLLDLSKDAHIQTTENFEKGKIATHNKKINYQKRYDDWQNDFELNKKGEKIIKKETRAFYDEGREKGSKTVHIDHTIPVAEIERDSKAAAHLTKEEKKGFANSDKNTNPLDAAANQSKKDRPMKEWLESEHEGKKPDERFSINKKELLEKDEEARKEFDDLKRKGEEKSIETGKASRRNEAFKIGGKALRAAIMVALADLIRNIISKLIVWLKQKEKNLQTLIEKIKEAIAKFISNLKRTILNMSEAVASTVLTAIGNPIANLIQRIWMIIKQGGRSIVDAIEYLSNPENKDKSFSIILLELGKIVIAGLTAIGGLVLGEYIEVVLSEIPVFAVQIPLIGSLANIIGMFVGAVVAGIAGALVLNLLDGMIAKQSRERINQKQVESGNKIVATQAQLVAVNEGKLSQKQAEVRQAILERHEEAAEKTKEVLEKIFDDDTSEQLDNIGNTLAEI